MTHHDKSLSPLTKPCCKTKSAKTTALLTHSKRNIFCAAMVGMVMGGGCATSSLLSDGGTRVAAQSATVDTTLVEDYIVAFGTPAQRLPNMPASSVVIVGEKNSYVLTQGGPEMVNLLTHLDAANIKVEEDMRFYSPNNDGYFQGKMALSYARLTDDLQRSDYQFFLQNGGTECSTSSDTRMGAQRFCFNVPIKGAVYPKVSNLDLIQSQYSALTRPYEVSVYTQTTTHQAARSTGGGNAGEKLIMLPFALAFDVVTLPIQFLGAIVD